MKLLVINGPNLNNLGRREPEIYGHTTYAELSKMLFEFASKNNVSLEIFQSNSEGEIIDKIQSADAEGIIINPAAYSHTSVAIHDALKMAPPSVEIHISNIYAREEFRHKSITGRACKGQISGLGIYGYIAAILYFLNEK